MALHHLLYRCPRCGADPTQGERDRAVCAACGRSYTRVREGRRIRILDRDGKAENALIQTLVGDIERLGGSMSIARQPDGSVSYAAAVEVRRGLTEDPVIHEGRLLGYIERMGEPEAGRLVIDEKGLQFLPAAGPATLWRFLELRAVQTSSAALQISPPDGPVVEFRFLEDSPFRWEDLVRTVLLEAYRRDGRGEIIEFQPRIVAA